MLSDFIVPESTSVPESASDRLIKALSNIGRFQFVTDAGTSMKPNPLFNRWDAKIVRAIIKRGYRIVSKR